MMQQRPAMQARDSSGNKVSLLNNDDEVRLEMNSTFDMPIYSLESADMARTASVNTNHSKGPGSPPELIRDSSYDSHGPVHSPSTPPFEYAVKQPCPVLHTGYPQMPHPYMSPQYPSYPVDPALYANSAEVKKARSASPPEDPLRTYPYKNNTPARYYPTNKKYPCRFRDTLSCMKEFTTSGHASRHAKIHTAEKSVQCSHPGCQKRFTRGDNMKQHLETHSKDKNRKSRLTRAAGVPKSGRPASRGSVLSGGMPSPTSYQMASPYAAAQGLAPASPYTAQPSNALDILASVAGRGDRQSFGKADYKNPY